MSTTFDETTEETLAAIAKAQTTGLLTATGAYSYDLTGIVRLIPVVTPFRDRVPRKASTDGNPNAIWRAFMNVTNLQPSPFAGFDYAGGETIDSEQDFQAPYAPLSLAGLVTQDAYDLAKGLYDPYAEKTMTTLNQYLIGEDRALVGAQSYNLAQPGAITATPSTTGGTMTASTTQKVVVAARTAMGYFYPPNPSAPTVVGNSRAQISAALTTTGTTASIALSLAAVKGAVAYDWFYTPNGSAPYFYYTTTTVATLLMTSTIVANNGLPSNTVCPDLFGQVPGTPNLAADNGSGVATGQGQQFNGLISSLTGDYNTAGQFVTPGTATANGAIFIDGLGAGLTLTGGSITQAETIFAGLWNAVKCSPTALMVNGAQAQELANLVLNQPSAVTYLQTDETGRVNVTAGGRVGQVVNTYAGGVTVPIEVHTSVPPGTIIARSDRVPFPQANISSVLECRTLRDTTQFDYATGRVANTVGGGPRKEFEIRSVEAFINRAPVAMAILSNVA
jgi:hypothetical protein